MKRGLLAPFEDLRLPVAAADLIVDYLTWPGRSAEVDRRAQRQCDLEGSRSLRERFDGQDRADARQADHRRKPPEPLVKYILDKRQEWPKEDVETSLVVLWNEVAQFGIWGWIGALVQLLGLRIEFESREPVVGLDCCEAWLRVTSRIDPDALLCYALARMGLADQVQALDRWGTSVRIADADLSMMLGEGVADLHVHLGGIRSALIAWQKLVLGDLRLEQLPRYAPHELQRLAGDPTLGRYRHEEKARLQWILELVHEGTSGLYFGANVRRRRGAGALADTGRFQRTFLYERRMMSRLFARGMPNFRRRSDSNGRDDLSDALLDFYVFAKSSFIEAHQQPIVTNPGLAAFRSYFRGTLPVGRDTSIKPLRWTPSAKLQAATQFADLAAYITQSRPLLKKLELRIGPLGTLSEYAQFFTAWRAVEKEFKLDAHGLEIRFAVHFKRSADRRKSRHTRSVPDLVGLQRELDAQAFTLHMLRRHSCSNPRCKLKESAARIARIDLAGQERDAPPDIAAFQMRLLRGDVDALDKLAEPGACDELAHKHWLLLDARKQAGLPVGVPRLRATCHAGEDFAHPLEGIYCMDIARESLKLGPGDTIGHGLAAGWNVEAFDRERTPRAVIREGSLFDSLLWLRCEIGRWLHPCGWTGEDVRIGLSGPGFRGESPWPRSAGIRSSSSGRLCRSIRRARPCTASPSATASAATWCASGLPRRRPASSTTTLRPRASCRSTRRGSARWSDWSASSPLRMSF